MAANASLASSVGVRLDAFDGLRACAALSIVAYHVGQLTGATVNGGLSPVISELKAGVTIFFVISGFLLYLPYARAIGARGSLPDWRQFARRRAVRILPAYWVALTLLAVGPMRSAIVTPNWWQFYGLAQIYDAKTAFGGLGVAWSLCVEATFYMALPVFAVIVARRASLARGNPAVVQLRLIGALALFSVALRLWLAGSLVAPIGERIAPIGHGATLATALPGLLDWFAWGMAMAVLRAEWESGRNLARPLATLAHDPARCWLLAAALFCVALPWQAGDTFLPLYGLATHVAVGLAAAALALPAVAAGLGLSGASAVRGWPLRFMASPAMVWLGTISYGIYLWHKPILDQIAGSRTAASLPLAAAPPLLAATVAGAIVLGAASWYVVERPAQRRWRPSRPAPVAVAA